MIFLAGAVGGMSPTVLRVAIDLVNGNTKIERYDASFLIGLLLLAAMGGTVASFFGERDLRKVLYIGVGLPSLFVVGANNATGRPAVGQAVPQGKSTSLFAPIRVLAASGDVPGRVIRFVLPQELLDAHPQAILSDGGTEKSVPVNNSDEVTVPDNARTIQIRTTLGSSEVTGLQEVPNSLSEVFVSARKNSWAGFLYAIGAHSDAYAISIRVGSPVARTPQSRVRIQCQIEQPNADELGKGIAEAFARVVLNVQNPSEVQLKIEGVAVRMKSGAVIESLEPANPSLARFKTRDGMKFSDFARASWPGVVRAEGNAYVVAYFPRTQLRTAREVASVIVRFQDDKGSKFQIQVVEFKADLK